MPTKAEVKDKEQQLGEQQRIEAYKKEYGSWMNTLQTYHTGRFQRNYNQYTAYTESKGTHTKISDPIAPEMTERIIQKTFERPADFYARAIGMNVPREITDTMGKVAHYFWNNPNIVQTLGNRRAQLKTLGREFAVIGNCATETYYNLEADAPDFKQHKTEDVIFNPAYTLKTSPRYYVRQYVDFKYLEDNAEITKDGKVKSGLYKNIDKLKKDYADEKANQDDRAENRINRVGSLLYERKAGQVELTSVWDGKHLTQIANWQYIIREADDPMSIGERPLNFAMDIELIGEPYALSYLDLINGLTKAKDLILNQIIDYGSKALNPPLFVDPALGPVARASLRNAWKLGGIVFANQQQASHQQMAPLPSVGFELLSYIQQRAESTSGIGGYLSGLPNQANDKTRGTYRGITALLEQQESPLKDRQLNLEESIIEPTVNQWLKMAANLMTDNEFKYVLIAGESPKWIKATKGLLSGKIKLDDLLQAEIVDEEEAMEIVQSLIEEGKDPLTEILFDVDWFIGVEAGSMAEKDREKELEQFDQQVQMGLALQLPLDKKKLWEDRGRLVGFKDPDKYYMPEQAEMTPGMHQMPDGSMMSDAEMRQNMPDGGQEGGGSGVQGAPKNPAVAAQGSMNTRLVEKGRNGFGF